MYVIIASGGVYEDVWQQCLTATYDKETADEVVRALEETNLAYKKAREVFLNEELEFFTLWESAHPEPEIVHGSRSPKPKHPVPHSSLKTIPRKEKKNLPLQLAYKAELEKYRLELIKWQRTDRQLILQEELAHDAWRAAREQAKKDFEIKKFKPNNAIPVGWHSYLNKRLKIIQSASSFKIEELEVIG